MSSTTGSTTPSAEPVARGRGRHARQAASDRRGARAARAVARESRRRARLSGGRGREARDRRADDRPTPTSSSCSAATGRCCARCGGSSARGVPVIGVNFGRVGFLTVDRRRTSSRPASTRVFAGELRASPSCRRSRRASTASAHVAVNDVVVRELDVGRMIELGWAVGGEDLGALACDGVICSTPSGSTAYNLSNGGPGARLGPRRDGGHVHRAALAARPPARRPARRDVGSYEPHARRAG